MKGNEIINTDDVMKFLDDGESILAVAANKRGDFGVATDKRVLIIGRSAFGRKMKLSKNLQYEQIHTIESSTKVFEPPITIITSEKKVILFVRKSMVPHFVETIEARITDTRLPDESAKTQVNKELVSLTSEEARIDKEWLDAIPEGWRAFGKDENASMGERRVVRTMLDEDEHIEKMIRCRFGDGRVSAGNTGVGITTNKRVLFVDKGIIRVEIREMRYGRIDSITSASGAIDTDLHIYGTGNAVIKVNDIYPRESAKVFADSIRRHIDDETVPAVTSSPVATVSVMAELAQAASLYRDGILTNEEFSAVKERILAMK